MPKHAMAAIEKRNVKRADATSLGLQTMAWFAPPQPFRMVLVTMGTPDTHRGTYLNNSDSRVHVNITVDATPASREQKIFL